MARRKKRKPRPKPKRIFRFKVLDMRNGNIIGLHTKRKYAKRRKHYYCIDNLLLPHHVQVVLLAEPKPDKGTYRRLKELENFK